VINADKVRLTGTKMDNQLHLRHTGYPGGQRSETPRQILARRPELLLEQAVRRMLPRTRLGRQVFHNMYVYAGTEHPHGAQVPKPLKLNL
jgi:large subunit ribosomal protein L13